jgi:hypothetical protein
MEPAPYLGGCGVSLTWDLGIRRKLDFPGSNPQLAAMFGKVG